MAPGNFAKRIKIIGGPSVRGAQATLGGIPHPTKITRAAPSSVSASGESSIISRKRKPIGPVRSTEGF